MPTPFSRALMGGLFAFISATVPLVVRADVAPIVLVVDASSTPTTSIVHVHETVPTSGGMLDLAYPRWVPGEHSPSGPIADLGGLTVTANGAHIPWTRDLADTNEFHIAVPAGATSVAIDFDFLGSTRGSYSGARLATKTILAINWNQFLLYPQDGNIGNIDVVPTIVLPGADWTAQTALPGPVRTKNSVTFAPATIERLVDSPLDAGTAYRRFVLLDKGGFTNEIDAFADRPSQLDASQATIAKFKNLVAEMDAIYGARHWKNYHFLLTVSDEMPGNGVEHGSSSDDGSGGDALTDPKAVLNTADLLAHEFNHSWDGKYRRPADLATTNFQVPEETNLLWIYEGMTQLYGNLVATRAGFWKPELFRDTLASYYAGENSEPGRLDRPLVDNATAAGFLYGAPRTLSGERRTAGDFYVEGALLWLDVDARLSDLSHGKKSLDGFDKTFFGMHDTPPMVDPYTLPQFLAALGAYQPYDWNAYFTKRVDDVAPRPPDPFQRLGWKLVYTDKPNEAIAERAKRSKSFYVPPALGIVGDGKGDVADVLSGSAAARGKLGMGDTIVAVDGREFTPEVLIDEVKATPHVTTPLSLIVRHGTAFRTVTIDYHGGLSFPHLVRIPGTPDLMSEITAPHRIGRTK